MRVKPPQLSGFRRGLALAQTQLVRALGRTPLAPKNTVVLRYTGPKSGRTIELPVWAVHDRAQERWVVGVGGGDIKTWWRTFRKPVAVTLTDTTGRQHDLEGVLVDGAERSAAMETYFGTIPSARRAFGAEAPFIVLTPRHG